MILGFLLTATAGGLPARAQAPRVRAGPDHTVEVLLGAQAYRYDLDGRLLFVGPAADAPAPGLVADGGGNHAELDPTRLVVTGARPCTLAVEARTTPEARVASGDDPWPARPAEPPFGVAVNADFAALTEKGGVLVVDLARCEPVAARSEDFDGAGGVALVGDTLVTVTSDGHGLRARRYALPTLAPLDGFTTRADGIVPGKAGPTLVVGEKGPQPYIRGALVGVTTTPLAGRTLVSGSAVFHLDRDGALRWLDGDGKVRGSAPAGSLARLGQAERGTGEWRVSDGSSVVRLVASEGDYALGRRAAGMVVTRAGQAWGVPLPAPGDNARVSPDGGVVVATDGEAVSAWQVADGRRLWTQATRGAEIAVGRDWVAVGGEGTWTFLDPGDGHAIGTLEPTLALRIGGALAPYDPARVRGAAWRAPKPAAGPLRAELPVADVLRPVEGCDEPEATLAPYSSLPELYNYQRAHLERACATRPSTALPAWPTTAVPATGASWAWTSPEPISQLSALEGGRLLVVTERGVGVLGPDGALLWRTEEGRRAYAVGDGVLVAASSRVIARGAATGEVRWSRAGELRETRDGLVLRATDASPFVRLDPRTGATSPIIPMTTGSSWGWACVGGPCVTELPVAKKDARRSVEVVDGDHTWLRAGVTITARGLPAPATSASPRLFSLALPPRPPLPPPMPVRDGPLRLAGPPPVAQRLVDGVDGTILYRDGAPAWTAEGRQRIGIVGDVAIVRDPLGAHEGRALADGRVLWTADLGERSAVTTQGGVLVGERDKWDILDERSGARIVHVDTKVAAVARDGDRTVLALGPRPPQVVREVGGAELGTVDDEIQQILLIGDVVVAVSYRGRLTGLSGGRVAWRVGPVRFQRVWATPTLVVLEGPDGTLGLDATTGELVDVTIPRR